jgi:hypothetical protein
MIPKITGVLHRRKLSPESLWWPSGHTVATVEFLLVLWFDSDIGRIRGEPLASAPSLTVAGDEHQHVVNVFDQVLPTWQLTEPWPSSQYLGLGYLRVQKVLSISYKYQKIGKT